MEPCRFGGYAPIKDVVFDYPSRMVTDATESLAGKTPAGCGSTGFDGFGIGLFHFEAPGFHWGLGV